MMSELPLASAQAVNSISKRCFR